MALVPGLGYAPTLVSACGRHKLRKAESGASGLPVSVEEGPPVGDTDTSSLCAQGNGTRENCWSPLLPGVAIGAGHTTVPGSIPWCTLAWHVHNDNADKKNQVLTAAHCLHNDTRVYHSSSFHNGAKVGDRTSTLETSSRLDLARVSMNFASEGNTIWIFGHGSGHILKDWANVEEGDPVRLSGAASKDVLYGTVFNAFDCWDNDIGNSVCGAFVSASSNDDWVKRGDSGAPVYLARQNAAGTWVRTPVGVQSGANYYPGTTTVKGSVWLVAKLQSAFKSGGAWEGWHIRGT